MELEQKVSREFVVEEQEPVGFLSLSFVVIVILFPLLPQLPAALGNSVPTFGTCFLLLPSTLSVNEEGRREGTEE